MLRGRFHPRSLSCGFRFCSEISAGGHGSAGVPPASTNLSESPRSLPIAAAMLPLDVSLPKAMQKIGNRCGAVGLLQDMPDQIVSHSLLQALFLFVRRVVVIIPRFENLLFPRIDWHGNRLSLRKCSSAYPGIPFYWPDARSPSTLEEIRATCRWLSSWCGLPPFPLCCRRPC